MANTFERGLSGSQVTQWAQNDTYTPAINTSFVNPYGLKLQQTITSSGSVTIPADITFVYAICVGGGAAGGSFTAAGGAGGIAWGWTLATSSCIIGAGGVGSQYSSGSGGYTQYGNLMAGGATGTNIGNSSLGAGGSGTIEFGSRFLNGGTNYWGISGSSGIPNSTFVDGYVGAGGGSGFCTTAAGATGGKGGDGISGGAGGRSTAGSGGKGGNGLAGGGGGGGNSTGFRTAAPGGNGVNIATGIITFGGLGISGTGNNFGSGGGGAGTAGNGGNGSGTSGGNGGLGGGGGGAGAAMASGVSGSGGNGGAGILYLYY